MILKKLIMHNFGVYASTNQFEFKGTNPVVLIGGMNGRGKTTFLEAALLATGVINRLGKVEDGNTVSDYDKMSVDIIIVRRIRYGYF